MKKNKAVPKIIICGGDMHSSSVEGLTQMTQTLKSVIMLKGDIVDKSHIVSSDIKKILNQIPQLTLAEMFSLYYVPHDFTPIRYAPDSNDDSFIPKD